MSLSCLKTFCGSLLPSKCLSWGLRPLMAACLIFHSPAPIPRTSSCSHTGPLTVLQPLHPLPSRCSAHIVPSPLCVSKRVSSVECLWALRARLFQGRIGCSLLCSHEALWAKTCTHATLFCDCLFLCWSPSVACELLGGRNHVLLISVPPASSTVPGTEYVFHNCMWSV